MNTPNLPIRIIMETLDCSFFKAKRVNEELFNDNSFYWNNATLDEMDTAIRSADKRLARTAKPINE